MSRRTRRVMAGEWDGDRESRKQTTGGVGDYYTLPMPLASSMRDSPKNPELIVKASTHLLKAFVYPG